MHLFLFTGIRGDAVIVARNTTINLTCTASGHRKPDRFVNEIAVVTSLKENGYTEFSTRNGVDQTATLTINGNLTCETLNVYCEVITTERQFVYMHNTTLRFQGWLQLI